MKIAHIVDSMEVGGAETLVWQMCRMQREQGHEPQVYAIAKLGALGERMRASGFVVRSQVGRHLVDSTQNFFRIFRAERPAVVHLHNPTAAIYAAPAARLAGVGSVISTRHSLVAAPRDLKMERKYRVAAMFCDWVVGICDATTNNLREAKSAPARKIVRVYNGAAPVGQVATSQRPPKSGFTFLYVGRLEPVKNLTLQLDAFRQVVSTNPAARLWVVGDGSQRAALGARAEELGLQSNVRFWGQQMDVAPFLRAADAFVMSSLSEGLPMSLLQALSCGLPAVVTDVGGMGEVVRLAQAGLTVPSGEGDAMAAAMVRMMSSEDERGGYSENARRAFEEHFTLRTMVAEYMRLYGETRRGRV